MNNEMKNRGRDIKELVMGPDFPSGNSHQIFNYLESYYSTNVIFMLLDVAEINDMEGFEFCLAPLNPENHFTWLYISEVVL